MARYVREQAAAAGHPSAARVVQGTISKILAAHGLHPHRVPYYLQRRDPDFDRKMVQVLHVYQQGELALDPEDGRRGTRTLWAGIDLATGEVMGLVRPRHRSREVVECLPAMEARYAPDVKIQIVLDNHSAHRSQETRAYLATRPNRFTFVFTPTHASWLNLIEMFFAKLAKQCLRGIRVETIEELETRIRQYLAWVNEDPVPFRWRGPGNAPGRLIRCWQLGMYLPATATGRTYI